MTAHPRDLKSLFGDALDRPAGPERSAYLDNACGRDSALRAEVEELLAVYDRAGRFLAAGSESPTVAVTEADDRTVDRPGTAPDASDTPTAASFAAAASGSRGRPPSEGPGTWIGPYRLLEKIGEGGMGAVYMAEQERPVRRRVALKIIKAGMDTAQVVARFEAERQALALMDHPNIARVLDAGATDGGRPFFVMELVNGAPITDYCDRARLTPQARLELFVPVCQAVQHAHQKGVIHRDIKPSNVLVTLIDGRPVPKVIDFGVAKATDQRLTERTMFTEFGAVVGTLEYMSPEQAELSGLDIDTRADVYSLGVLLYELLTGTTPLERARLRQAGYAEILRRIREEEPPKPSTRLSSEGARLPSIAATRGTEPRRLSRLVRGELDWVVMKALEKDRARRYETASGLASDVHRYLVGEAVEACPPSRTYRLRKFAGRHRGALTTAVAFAALLILAAAVSLTQAVRATRAEQAARRAAEAARAGRDRAVKAESRARAEAGKARAVNDFLTEDLLTQAAPDKHPVGDRVTLLEVLDRAAETVGERFRADPASEEAVRQTIARTYRTLAAYEKAERQWQVVLESARRRLGPDAPEVFRAQDGVAVMRQIAGRSDAGSLALAHSAAEGLARTLGPDHPDTLASRRHLALALMSAGRAAEAVALHEDTVKAKERVLGPDHRETLLSRADLAEAYMVVGRTAEAVALLESTLRARESTLGPDHPDALTSRSYLAAAYVHAGRAADAVALLEPVMATIETKFGFDHRVAQAARSHLARAYRATGRSDAAAVLRPVAPGRSVPARASAPGARSIPDDLRSAAQAAALGGSLLQHGRLSEAEMVFREALRVREAHAPDDWSTYSTRSSLGAALLEQGRFAEAEPLVISGYVGLKSREASIAAPYRPRLSEAAERVVALYRAWGKPEVAEEWVGKLGLADLPDDVFAPPPKP